MTITTHTSRSSHLQQRPQWSDHNHGRDITYGWRASLSPIQDRPSTKIAQSGDYTQYSSSVFLNTKLSSLTVGFFIGMAACGYFSGWASWLHRGLCWMRCDAHHSSLLSLLLQKVCLLHLYHLFCQIYCMRFYTRFYRDNSRPWIGLGILLSDYRSWITKIVI